MFLSRKPSNKKPHCSRTSMKQLSLPFLPRQLYRNACIVVLLVALVAMDRGLMALASPLSSDDALSVNGWQKISNGNGGLENELKRYDLFGHSVAPLGDLNGDGVPDLAVGAFGDDDGGFNTGAIYVLFLNRNGTVSSESKISSISGGKAWRNNNDLYNNAIFGAKLGSAGDLDGDGINELIVGNYKEAWILSLNKRGKVRKWQKITQGQGNFDGQLSVTDQFGSAVSTVGDVDGDGVPDLAIGACRDDTAGLNAGAVWILFMNSNGTVKSHLKIPSVGSGFFDSLSAGSLFGTSVALIGDIEGNGNTAIAVGQMDAVWILSLDNHGQVVWSNKFDPLDHSGYSAYGDGFGWDVSEAGDIDYDGIPDLLVSRSPSSGENGEVWLLLLNADGTVKTNAGNHFITDGIGNFPADTIQDTSSFGSSVALLGDVNGDGYSDVAVGAIGNNDVMSNSGAVWVVNIIPPAAQN